MGPFGKAKRVAPRSKKTFATGSSKDQSVFFWTASNLIAMASNLNPFWFVDRPRACDWDHVGRESLKKRISFSAFFGPTGCRVQVQPSTSSEAPHGSSGTDRNKHETAPVVKREVYFVGVKNEGNDATMSSKWNHRCRTRGKRHNHFPSIWPTTCRLAW